MSFSLGRRPPPSSMRSNHLSGKSTRGDLFLHITVSFLHLDLSRCIFCEAPCWFHFFACPRSRFQRGAAGMSCWLSATTDSYSDGPSKWMSTFSDCSLFNEHWTYTIPYIPYTLVSCREVQRWGIARAEQNREEPGGQHQGSSGQGSYNGSTEAPDIKL